MSSTERAAEAIAGRVVVVRHAQASFGSDDYDQLSAHGLQQAQQLGLWLAAQQRRCTWVTSGTQRRHAQTLAAITQAYTDAGLTLPPCVVDADWNEFDHTAVIGAYARARADDPQLALARDSKDKRAMHAVLAAALHAWARDELADVGESWNAFATRTLRARARLAQQAPPGTALVISSGGVIARCAQAALGVDDARTVELNLGLRNTAISEFRRDDAGWQMLVWNSLPHFAGHDERAWVTYY